MHIRSNLGGLTLVFISKRRKRFQHEVVKLRICNISITITNRYAFGSNTVFALKIQMITIFLEELTIKETRRQQLYVGRLKPMNPVNKIIVNLKRK